MRTAVVGVAVVALLLLAAGGCGGSGGGGGEPSIQERFDTSLHKTREGKRTWYEEGDGLTTESGFFHWAGIDYDSMACKDCHDSTRRPDWTEPDCLDCHDVEGDTPEDDTCLGCHKRQAGEASFDDWHIDELGMDCIDCHDGADLHGTGTAYDSMWDAGAMDVACIDCHSDAPGASAGAPDPTVAAHEQHLDTIDCSACHVQTVTSCINCHLDSGYGNPAGKVQDWIFLVNRNGKVHAGTIMTLYHEGNDARFAVIGPYFAHTIQPEGRSCDDCHLSEALIELNRFGSIDLLSWSTKNSSFNHPSGVIPVPPDVFRGTDTGPSGKRIYEIDYVRYDDTMTSAPGPVTGPWWLVDGSYDQLQMIEEYAAPLTQAQFDGLNRWASSLHATRLGKATWYSSANGGMDLLPDTPDFWDLTSCFECHSLPAWEKPSCVDCHGTNDVPLDPDPVSEETCLACHKRQTKEIDGYGFTDYHRDELGFECMSCHTEGDVHGDGTRHLSMWSDGAIDAKCEDCHTGNNAPDSKILMHSMHVYGGAGDIDCSACHMQASHSCVNCHLGYNMDPNNAIGTWKFLLNRNGKVHAGTLMTLASGSPIDPGSMQTFAAFAPFYAHNIDRYAISSCDDCHDNQVIDLFNDTGGTVPLLVWDETERKVLNFWDHYDPDPAKPGAIVTAPTPIIPIPPNWNSPTSPAFLVEFSYFSPGDMPGGTNQWEYLKSDVDLWQMIDEFGAALTWEQMEALGYVPDD